MAQSYCLEVFGKPDLNTVMYALIFSTQDDVVISHVTKELQKVESNIRLVFATSSVGMGFDSPCITNIVHAKPPRNMVDFVQQIGRAGRVGQPSQSVLYFNKSDIAANVQNMSEDIRALCKTDNCLRLCVLKVFGFTCTAETITPCKCCSICCDTCDCGNCNLHVDQSM